VGGAEITGLPLEELRGQVALVTQEHHIFRGTLRENLSLGRQGAADGELRSALAAVEALGWATALDDGLETRVGSGGVQLTAAQAQQVALARSARRLERSLSAVLDGRTVVAIAHRLHTAHDADRVVVMEDGQISEMGPHHELVEAGGAYSALWESWHGAAARPPAQPAQPGPRGAPDRQVVDGDVDRSVESRGAQGINGRCPVDD
jgi:ABC-type multidrug transport system fused ATPase/permease subunit